MMDSVTSTFALSGEALAAVDFDAAATAAARRGSDFFPSRLGLRAFERSDVLRKTLRTRFRRGFAAAPAEMVLVPKWGGTSRPAADLGAAERIALDALITYVRSQIPDGIVNWSPQGDLRTTAERALTQGEHTHVLVTDIVSCYEYIDRSSLIGEVEDLVADDAVGALEILLDAVMVKHPGLPQGAPLVGVLADIYLSIADRELARSGVPVVRWADDYRIPGNSFQETTAYLIRLEAALRALGLVVSPGKTWTPTRETYGEWTEDRQTTSIAVAQLRARIQARIQEEYQAPDEDDDEREAPTVDPAIDTAFVEAFADDDAWPPIRELMKQSRRLRTILPELGRTGSDLPLQRLELLLDRYCHLTRDIVAYLRWRMRAGHPDDVVARTSDVLASRAYRYEWQKGWLLHALIPAPARLPTAVIEIAESSLYSQSDASFIRGRAALLLATEDRLPSAADLGDIYEELPHAAQIDVAAAAAVSATTANMTSFTRAVKRDPVVAAVLADVADGSPYAL